MSKNLSDQSLKIRKMDMSDVPFVYRQETTIFGQMLEEKALYEEIIQNDIAFYYIALLDGVRVGYIGGWAPEPNAEIITVFVRPNYRLKHIGRSLVSFMIDEMKKIGIESITLEVRPTNVGAISLYKSFGFEKVSVRKNYYKDGEDALMMYVLIGGHNDSIKR